MDWQRVPQAWSSSRKTSVAETFIGISRSPVAVRAGGWLQHRVRHHSALSVVSWRSDLRGAANTQQLQRQNFSSRWTSLVELSSGPAAQSRHRLRTVQTTAEGTALSRSMNAALCDFWYAAPYKTLTYLLTYLLKLTKNYSIWENDKRLLTVIVTTNKWLLTFRLSDMLYSGKHFIQLWNVQQSTFEFHDAATEQTVNAQRARQWYSR